MGTGKWSFPKADRLTKRADYLRVAKIGNKVHTRHFLILWTRNHLPNSRLGITITKKVAKAVGRNRLKRRLREAFRLGGKVVPRGIDLVVIAKQGSNLLRSLEIRNEFQQGLGQIAVKAGPGPAKEA